MSSDIPEVPLDEPGAGRSTWTTVKNLLLLVVGVVALLVIGVVVVVVKAWFWSTVKDAGADTIEPRPAVPAVTLPTGRRVYVALGDSYSSGEGVGPYLDGSQDADDGGDRCHRSADAYSQQIEFVPDVEIRFRACSGAVVADMYSTQSTAGGATSSALSWAREFSMMRWVS